MVFFILSAYLDYILNNLRQTNEYPRLKSRCFDAIGKIEKWLEDQFLDKLENDENELKWDESIFLK